MRREKEAAKLKAAIERATARKIAKGHTELVEDEHLELMELAAASKGLPSVITLDSDTLQQLDVFKGLFCEPCHIYIVVISPRNRTDTDAIIL